MLVNAEALGAACQRCLLPELQSEIGSDLLDSKHFDSFRLNLNDELHKIFDAIHNSELLTPAVQPNLVLLYCEQTASHGEYKTDEAILEQCLETLGPRIEQWMSDRETWDKVLAWYKTRVTTNGWKRNMGATHGLARMCEVIYCCDLIKYAFKT